MIVNEVPREHVLLVHGLWMNRVAMWPLAWRLRRTGFEVSFFGYYSALQPHERHTEKLAEYVAGLPHAVLHLVGHSLGGVLILNALTQLPQTKVRSVLALGSPLRGSTSGLQFMRHALGRFCVGRSGSLWQTFPVLRVPEGVRVGTIAGTRRIGLGRFFASLPGPNDGVVTVAETQLPGLADHIVLPVSHTGMLISKSVASQSIAFLRGGRFDR